MKLSSLVLGIDRPQESLNYYLDALGMVLTDRMDEEKGTRYRLRFPNSPHSAFLELLHPSAPDSPDEEPYRESPSDNYWKYSLFVDDIDRVSRRLPPQYVHGRPFQFRQIGYLLHTADNTNYKIEFIQKYFKENTKPSLSETQYPLEESPVFGLITLRTKDPVKSINFFEQTFALKFMVRMYVPKDGNQGFTLYFLGPEHLNVPNLADPDAIENREWLYQQKETFIELQYYWGTERRSDFTLIDKSDDVLGLKEIVFECDDLDAVARSFRRAKRAFDELYDAVSNQRSLSLRSPDMHAIRVRLGSQ